MIGNAIKAKLKASPDVTNKVGDKIYPVRSRTEQLPAIYYSIVAKPEYVKGSSTMKSFTVTVLTMCGKYHDSWLLSIAVKEAIEGKKWEHEGIKIVGARCENIADDN
jgi:hypothetical protein